MAKQELYNSDIPEIEKGVFIDCDPLKQPKGTRRFTLNGIEEVIDGKNKVSNEPSNYSCDSFTDGFYPIGNEYIGDDNSVVLLTDPLQGIDEIGIIDKDDKYKVLVHTGVLGLSITNQCDIIFRLRRGKERVIYWVDGNKLIRTFNLDRPHNFYNQVYKNYIKAGGNPDTYLTEKWDVNSFNLIKTYSQIPFFGTPEILESGNILPGSYNFAIQLVDDDLNPTTWITTSNTINIYNDTTINSYGRIRGSRNVTNDAQSFPRANKAIKLNIYNLDQSFPYYRIGIIRASNNTGDPDKVLVSDLYSTSDGNFVYTGNDENLKETSLESILIENEIIYAPKHIEQLENRLIVANTKGKGENWCDFQKYASKISTDLATKEVLLNNINSQPNVKNANSTFLYRGYMPGEVYSMGIVYVFDDMSLSPVYHIPGVSNTNNTSLLKPYELVSSYLDIHNCSTDNYWGLDSEGNGLVGNPIRHHRFPFRSEVSKPLVLRLEGTTTNITKYRLKLVISLNPAFTPSPSYPDNGDSPPSPLLIPYRFNYQVLGAGSPTSFNGQLTKSIVDNAIEIVLYNDTIELDTIGLDYSELQTITGSLSDYQDNVNDRFIITETYESYVLSSSYNDDIAEIFGFNFSNIERPRADIIGFYIVRNQRNDDDRLIIDNAIVGPNTKSQQYVSFGLLMPKQYYNVNNCGRTASSGKTLEYDDKSFWFFNPEFEFLNKKLEFDELNIQGTYTQSTFDMPTISDTEGSTCNGGSVPFAGIDTGGTRGVLIQDVQAGTSYDPSVNKKKNKDDDGFDLVIGYRNNNVVFSGTNNVGTILPAKKRVIYLNAASYQNFDSLIYYNVSVDNKIGMYMSDETYDTTKLTNTDGSNKNALFYASMIKNNTTAYSNFINRPYYKEHNNPVLFQNLNIVNNFEVFNGDTQISGMNLVSSVFYDMVVADRPKKSKIWKIVVGAVLLVAGVLLAIPSAGVSLGLTAAGATALSALAISYGVSLAMTGIKFEQYKSMIDTDYEKGLKDTVTDGGVYETIRDTIGREDDNIRWFADRVSHIYIESNVSFGLRSGLTSGVSDFTDAPQPYDEAEFRTYLIEKLTSLDRQQGSGRVYKGYAGAEVYDMNLDYMRFNKQKEFDHLAIEYDCCSDYKEEYPLRRWFSEQSFQEEKIDNYRVFLPNNYSDMEGEHGEITSLYRLGNNLFVHTREALWQQPANLQERITDEIVSFIGTGAFLSIPPRKIIDDALGSGGTQHKWATIKTKNGVFSLSELESMIYIHGEKINYLDKGVSRYFNENIVSFLVKQLYDNFGIVFKNDNNPANPNGVGYISTYDVRYERVLFTKRDYLLLENKLELLNIISYIPVVDNDIFYFNINNNTFYLGTTQINLDNTNYFENKSLTISYSFKIAAWSSWHNYLPNYYIRSKNSMYSFISSGNNSIWKHNQEGSYGNFYGIQYPFIVERVGIISPLQDSTYEDLTIQTNARQWDVIKKQFVNKRYITFNKIWLYNNTQHSGETLLIVKETNGNPKDWYSQQIKETLGSLLISKSGENWNLNSFRNYVIDYNNPMFSSLWEDIKDNYFTDKVVNSGVIDFNKNWYELESFRDKFIVIRLIFDNFNGISLGLNYSIDTQQISE